ncbi:hypothetical protein SERLA73DRAFT_186905 [Serpula lacrymans var. lacrymans S7.3]|uniref:Uncharacterized protein n=2 Tax=Serpula lacrymans var. lacrymans TaxID=341189 RepID=F8Q833_SERL3|nr:uncharacterized protein SERLADRAFT_476186 [Serpula lacrymans var. lacrymans S7.9]EGN95721.1 hypothetical protein SERLA73DRAFT_186905 [Serpula lacrymans var. lacrymans S7.3]EGO21245.1 hypothetical protein SERLADRAFT_476186 [Serpula lacrymans var. lacrymans S7.9]
MVALIQNKSSPIHSASLVDPALHSPALLELLQVKLSRPVIEYVVDCVVDTVDYAIGRPSSSSRGRSLSRRPEHTAFTTFVSNVLTRAEVPLAVVLVSLVYIDRAKPHLQIALEEWACERVFLGAVMVASKYLNDSTLKNVHWALCTGVFGKRDVGRIEREFLDVLDFELGVTEDDVLSQHDGLSAVALPTHNHRRVSSKHTPRTASRSTHHRESAHTVCPDLDPSSPKSSSSSSSPSPRTPESLVYPPESLPKAHHKDLELSMPTHAVPAPVHSHQPKKSHPYPSTLDLLRSFPLPISQSNSVSSHEPHTHYSHLLSYPFTSTQNPLTQVAA